MVERYVADPVRGLIPADQFYAEKRAQQYAAQSHLPSPRIASDVMEPVQSMHDGKMYDSKSKIRASYRAAGVTEVGNDPAIFRKNKPVGPDRNAIRASIGKAFSRAGLGA